MELKRKYYEN